MPWLAKIHELAGPGERLGEAGDAGGEIVGLADGIRPPGIHEAERFGNGHGGQAGQRELDHEPPGPGDALCPGQPIGPGLELAGDQRGTPEDADDRGRGEDERDAK